MQDGFLQAPLTQVKPESQGWVEEQVLLHDAGAVVGVGVRVGVGVGVAITSLQLLTSHVEPASRQTVRTHLLVVVEQVWSCGHEFGVLGLQSDPQAGAPKVSVSSVQEVVAGGEGVASKARGIEVGAVGATGCWFW